ncbi:MAG: hypothetical protein EBZ59_10420, partial [Planctomycetia bacterium]|nr:hypothetical protein [Planctomycetia bacterium]
MFSARAGQFAADFPVAVHLVDPGQQCLAGILVGHDGQRAGGVHRNQPAQAFHQRLHRVDAGGLGVREHAAQVDAQLLGLVDRVFGQQVPNQLLQAGGGFLGGAKALTHHLQ